MTATATNPISRLVELDVRKRELEEELKGISEERAAIEEQLLDKWAEEGVQNMRVNGMTVYLHRQLWASVKPDEKSRAIDIFEANGMKDMLSVNTQTLSAWVREQEEGGIPEAIKEILNTEERFAIRTRRSS